MALTPVAIARHAATAGWRGADLPTAVAVALAASGGEPGRAGGLWGVPGDPAGDAAGAAGRAYARWRAGGWNAFPTYRSSAYVLFLPLALPAVAHPDVVAVVAAPAVEGFVGGLKDAAASLPGADVLDAARGALALGVKAGAWLGERHNWVRIAQVVIGAGMIIAAVGMVSRPDQKLGGFVGATTRAVGKLL